VKGALSFVLTADRTRLECHPTPLSKSSNETTRDLLCHFLIQPHLLSLPGRDAADGFERMKCGSLIKCVVGSVRCHRTPVTLLGPMGLKVPGTVACLGFFFFFYTARRV
jgi:hypothetical protein